MLGESTKHPAERRSVEWSGRSMDTSQLPEHHDCSPPLPFLPMAAVASPEEAASGALEGHPLWELCPSRSEPHLFLGLYGLPAQSVAQGRLKTKKKPTGANIGATNRGPHVQIHESVGDISPPHYKQSGRIQIWLRTVTMWQRAAAQASGSGACRLWRQARESFLSGQV